MSMVLTLKKVTKLVGNLLVENSIGLTVISPLRITRVFFIALWRELFATEARLREVMGPFWCNQDLGCFDGTFTLAAM